MKGLIIIANGFEDTEALTTIDVLKRSGLEVVTATPNENLIVTTQYKHEIKAQVSLKNIMPNDYDFLILPGGGAVFNVLHKLEDLPKLINHFVSGNKLVAAICAAPSILGRNGLLKGIKYTCFPGCEDNSYQGEFLDKGVVADKFITAKSMYYTIDFALEIIKRLQGEEQMIKVSKNIKGEK